MHASFAVPYYRNKAWQVVRYLHCAYKALASKKTMLRLFLLPTS
jgi:hypothetical protein